LQGDKIVDKEPVKQVL